MVGTALLLLSGIDLEKTASVLMRPGDPKSTPSFRLCCHLLVMDCIKNWFWRSVWSCSISQILAMVTPLSTLPKKSWPCSWPAVMVNHLRNVCLKLSMQTGFPEIPLISFLPFMVNDAKIKVTDSCQAHLDFVTVPNQQMTRHPGFSHTLFWISGQHLEFYSSPYFLT